MHPRRFARVRPTGKMSSVAKVIVGPRAPIIDCSIVDYSAGGACLEVCGQTKLPNRFELASRRDKKALPGRLDRRTARGGFILTNCKHGSRFGRTI
jgi:hypothetical protein